MVPAVRSGLVYRWSGEPSTEHTWAVAWKRRAMEIRKISTRLAENSDRESIKL